ncbi:C40 family peptidase [Bacillus thermotolerans]|uniref:NLP/P60 family protein n=1 Tax=Bacillus thermotolerans TaxID=1221996 RepID=A0A0F5HPV1_BACTR|nr:C40 family peptidase [Bacillus thermotolerans]KKB35399.1 NLP/P60 family protein [Bacillus thermotolerans]KKB36240.1 NLP/P60 family protein [Bacillus thermotolerans]KKB39047.1 NLP/P60 family protein [Bacillus thermotolerans]
MSLSSPHVKWVTTVFVILALVAAFVFGTAPKASATINYGEEVASVAKRYVGSPYKWGGTTPKGFDASGFTQYVYKHAATKKAIPRTSAAQYKIGKSVPQSQLKQGDLVFYATGKKGVVSFVGIYSGNGTFIGVTTKGVKSVKMSDTYWKTKYMGAKRVVQ